MKQHGTYGLLALILALTAIKGALWSIAIPLWQGPDENRHFATVQFIAERGRLPGAGNIYHDDENVIASELAEVSRLWYNPGLRQTFGPGTVGPNEAAIAALDPSLRTSTERAKITLALHLPPLYYLMGALFYLPVRNGDILQRVFAVRQLSVLLGLITVWCAYLTARQVFPQRPAMWLTVPVLVSFQPMFTFISAVVNTDALMVAVMSATIYLLVRTLQAGLTPWRAVGLGLLFGAGLLTKPFTLAMAVPLAVAVGWELARSLRGQRRSVGRVVLDAGLLAASALAVWGGWALRSVRLGNNPFYANPIRLGQLELAHPFYDYALGRYLSDYVISLFGGTWVSFWGDFGWIEAPLDRGYYLVLYAIVALAGAGALLYFIRAYRCSAPARRPADQALDANPGSPSSRSGAGPWAAARSGESTHPRPSFWVRFGQQAGLVAFLGLCAAALIGTLGAINYYSWRSRGVGGGIQGRYYLGAIVPFVTLIALGLLEWIPQKWRAWGHWILRWGMMALQWVSLFQVVIPRYYL